MTERITLVEHVRSKSPSAVIFDLDGTLIESGNLHFESLSYALSRQGLDVSRPWYDRRTGLTLDQLLAELAEEAQSSLDVNRAASDQLTYFTVHLDRLTVSEDCLELLKELEPSVL